MNSIFRTFVMCYTSLDFPIIMNWFVVRMSLFLYCFLIDFSMEQRSKRFLTFPPTTPTRVQIISGIGIPVDLELESVTIGYVFKAEFFLPENASNYLNILADPFDISTQPISGFFNRKKRVIEESELTENPNDAVGDLRGYDIEQNEKFEKHQIEAEVVESGTESNEDKSDWQNDDSWFKNNVDDRYRNPLSLKSPQNLATSRWTIYKGMAILAESKGLAGRSCVLRSICESAHAPFDYSNGILGELMHVIMTPSLTNDEITDHSDYEYYRAEKIGKDGAPCEHVFNECKISILDKFTGIYTPMMDLFNRLIS